MKKQLSLILISALCFVLALFTSALPQVQLILFLAAYLIVGHGVLWSAGKNILHGHIFDENFLMSIASLGALLIGDRAEAVFVIIFYQVGELFQDYAVKRSKRSITELMAIRPDSANRVVDGEIIVVDPEDLKPGEIILIRPGEKVPLDARVTQGESQVDTSMMTGESVPRVVRVGDELISGCVNLRAVLQAVVLREFEESTVNKILDLVENASMSKSRQERFITRFARIYTPAVVITAALLAFLPPLLVPGQIFSEWIYRALNFLVVSCPCALVISIPLSFFGGLGGASRAGILVKGANYLEALARTELVAWDKTGTLTAGVFEVTRVDSKVLPEAELLALAALAETHSTHPIAQSLMAAVAEKWDEKRLTAVEELSGHGIRATIDDSTVRIGKRLFLEAEGIQVPAQAPNEHGSEVYISKDEQYLGRIFISDRLKPDAADAVQSLTQMGVRHQVLLSGDTKENARAFASKVGIKEVAAELLPQDKVTAMERLIAEKRIGTTVLYVGDGINDAPVLALADVGIAMGAFGSEAAIEAADVVIMTDEPRRVPAAIRIARRTVAIAKQNTIFAIGVKLIVLVLSAVGLSSMWAAVFADVGVAVIAILNAMRALSVDRDLKIVNS